MSRNKRTWATRILRRIGGKVMCYFVQQSNEGRAGQNFKIKQSSSGTTRQKQGYIQCRTMYILRLCRGQFQVISHTPAKAGVLDNCSVYAKLFYGAKYFATHSTCVSACFSARHKPYMAYVVTHDHKSTASAIHDRIVFESFHRHNSA